MSIYDVYSRAPNNNSGALYHKVTTLFVYLGWEGFNNLASPKSAILTSP
jgi:hypothetical protein